MHAAPFPPKYSAVAHVNKLASCHHDGSAGFLLKLPHSDLPAQLETRRLQLTHSPTRAMAAYGHMDEFSALLEDSPMLLSALDITGHELTSHELTWTEPMLQLQTGQGQTTEAEPKTSQNILAAKRRYREKQKKELRALRAARDELSTTLSDLEANRAVSTAQLLRTTDRAPGWRGVAFRQYQRRVEAEVLNRQLWSQVRAHHALAEHAKNALQLRLSGVNANQAIKLVPSRRKPAMQLTELDQRLFTTFVNEMDALHRQTDRAFADCELPLTNSSRYHSQVSRKRDLEIKSEYVELVESFMIPFEVANPVDAFHSAMTSQLEEESAPATVDMPDSDTIAIKFQIGRDEAEQYQTSLVSKGFVEDGRTVFVWRSFTTRRGSSAKYVEAGWITVRRVPNGSSGVGMLVQYCSRFRPLHWTKTSDHSRDDYVNMLVDCGEKESLEFTQAIENTVLSDLLAKRAEAATVRA